MTPPPRIPFLVRVLASIAFLLACASPVPACEPILPVAILILGPDTGFAIWGALGGLAIGVAAKCFVFSIFAPELGRVRAFLFMLVANVVTSIAGAAAALWFMAPSAPMFLATTAGVLLISTYPAERLRRFPGLPRRARFAARGLAGWISLSWAAGAALFAASRFALVELHETGRDPGAVVYWTLKFGFVLVGVVSSLLFTTIWEEWIVARLARRTHPDGWFHDAAFRANAATFLLGWGLGAAAMLPARLDSPGFLVRLLDAALAALG